MLNVETQKRIFSVFSFRTNRNKITQNFDKRLREQLTKSPANNPAEKWKTLRTAVQSALHVDPRDMGGSRGSHIHAQFISLRLGLKEGLQPSKAKGKASTAVLQSHEQEITVIISSGKVG